MSMYASETSDSEPKPKPIDNVVDKRIVALESKVSNLINRVDGMQSALDDANRNNRKLKNDLNAVTMILRSRK
jgi:hypothetical protein